MPVKSLSETFQVSARTIRYALEEIDDYLRDHQQPPLKRNRKKGVYYDCDQEVLHKLLGSDTLHFPDAANREAFLVFAFFYAKEKVTVPSICEHLLVSKSTVDKDIQRLRTELLLTTCEKIVCLKKDLPSSAQSSRSGAGFSGF